MWFIPSLPIQSSTWLLSPAHSSYPPHPYSFSLSFSFFVSDWAPLALSSSLSLTLNSSPLPRSSTTLSTHAFLLDQYLSALFLFLFVPSASHNSLLACYLLGPHGCRVVIVISLVCSCFCLWTPPSPRCLICWLYRVAGSGSRVFRVISPLSLEEEFSATPLASVAGWSAQAAQSSGPHIYFSLCFYSHSHTHTHTHIYPSHTTHSFIH